MYNLDKFLQIFKDRTTIHSIKVGIEISFSQRVIHEVTFWFTKGVHTCYR